MLYNHNEVPIIFVSKLIDSTSLNSSIAEKTVQTNPAKSLEKPKLKSNINQLLPFEIRFKSDTLESKTSILENPNRQFLRKTEPKKRSNSEEKPSQILRETKPDP